MESHAEHEAVVRQPGWMWVANRSGILAGFGSPWDLSGDDKDDAVTGARFKQITLFSSPMDPISTLTQTSTSAMQELPACSQTFAETSGGGATAGLCWEHVVGKLGGVTAGPVLGVR